MRDIADLIRGECVRVNALQRRKFKAVALKDTRIRYCFLLQVARVCTFLQNLKLCITLTIGGVATTIMIPAIVDKWQDQNDLQSCAG